MSRTRHYFSKELCLAVNSVNFQLPRTEKRVLANRGVGFRAQGRCALPTTISDHTHHLCSVADLETVFPIAPCINWVLVILDDTGFHQIRSHSRDFAGSSGQERANCDAPTSLTAKDLDIAANHDIHRQYLDPKPGTT